MNGDEKTKTFWGLIALATAYLKYKTAKAKGNNMEPTTKLGTENLKNALDTINDIGVTAIHVAKDGIDMKKDATIVYDELVQNPEFRGKFIKFIQHTQEAFAEAKDLDLMEGIDLAKFEYEDGIKPMIEAFKK